MLVVELQRCLNRARYPLPSDHVILCGGGDTTPADVGGEMNVRKADVVGCQRKGSKRQWKEAYDSHTNTKDPVTYKNTSLLYVLVSLLCSLHRIIMKELLNEVYMSENHASATISFQLKFIESIPFTHVFCEELKVRVPFVADDFSAREAADRNDHIAN